MLTYPDGSADELDCLPPATRAEILARYPGAEVEPLPGPTHEAEPDR